MRVYASTDICLMKHIFIDYKIAYVNLSMNIDRFYDFKM